MTATLYKYLARPDTDPPTPFPFDEKNKLRVFIPRFAKASSFFDINKYIMQVDVVIADEEEIYKKLRSHDHPGSQWVKTPQSEFLRGALADTNVIKYNNMLLDLRKTLARSKSLTKFYNEYVLSQPNGVSLDNFDRQKIDSDFAKKLKGVITGFNFRLGDYGDKGDKPFYLIKVERGNLRTLDSLMIPKWFLRDKNIKDFLLDLDKLYTIILPKVKESFEIQNQYSEPIGPPGPG